MANWIDKPNKNGWYVIRNKDKSNPLFASKRHLVFVDDNNVFDNFAHPLTPLNDKLWDNQEFHGPLDLE